MKPEHCVISISSHEGVCRLILPQFRRILNMSRNSPCWLVFPWAVLSSTQPCFPLILPLRWAMHPQIRYFGTLNPHQTPPRQQGDFSSNLVYPHPQRYPTRCWYQLVNHCKVQRRYSRNRSKPRLLPTPPTTRKRTRDRGGPSSILSIVTPQGFQRATHCPLSFEIRLAIQIPAKLWFSSIR